MQQAIAIKTASLTKLYGQKRGVLDLDLAIVQGEVFGFLGPNGAGKTTTIRTLLDFIRPTTGSVEVLGMDPHQHSVEVRRRVGYLPGELTLYEQLTGWDLLRHFGALRGGVPDAEMRQLADRLDLDLSRPIRSLSKGNKQKVGLVQALMHKPELLILDEPTSGLDPLVQQEFNQLVREAHAAGQTVFLSSHVLSEVEQVCDRVGIIREGRLVLVDQVRAIKARAVRQVEATFAEAPPAEIFAALPGVSDVRLDGATLRCTVSGSMDTLIKALAGFTCERFVSADPDLEEIFLTYYKKGDDNAA